VFVSTLTRSLILFSIKIKNMKDPPMQPFSSSIRKKNKISTTYFHFTTCVNCKGRASSSTIAIIVDSLLTGIVLVHICHIFTREPRRESIDLISNNFPSKHIYSIIMLQNVFIIASVSFSFLGKVH